LYVTSEQINDDDDDDDENTVQTCVLQPTTTQAREMQLLLLQDSCDNLSSPSDNSVGALETLCSASAGCGAL